MLFSYVMLARGERNIKGSFKKQLAHLSNVRINQTGITRTNFISTDWVQKPAALHNKRRRGCHFVTIPALAADSA